MASLPSLLIVNGIVTLILTSHGIDSCTIAGRFGDACLYKCHCADDEVCDSVTGQCPNDCARGWFGPACQYASSMYEVGEGLDEATEQWLLDADDSTCNGNRIEPLVTLRLNAPHPLTWIRVVLSNRTGAYPDDIKLSYKTATTNAPLILCPAVQLAMANPNTLDVSCPTSGPVTEVTISGPKINSLCSVYISRGRNLALFQSVSQSSTHEEWVPENAVDGVIAPDNSTDAIFEQTCTHTRASDTIGQWSLNFDRPFLPSSFVIYNRVNDDRGDCCEERLVGFTLSTVDDQDNVLYSYSDPGGPAQKVYTVVPETRLERAVRKLNISKSENSTTLTLCEVEVYGDSACSDGTYGRDCDGVCNCNDQEGSETCLVSTGGCPSGCQAGFKGENCYTACDAGEFGPSCTSTCSPYCAGTDRACNAVDGNCTSGCTEGYQPPTCISECPMTTFGQDCSQSCNTSCLNSDCDHRTGPCRACPPGVNGDFCQQDCSEGSWGPGCVNNCSIHCADSNQTCDRYNGSCTDGCQEGYEPPLCANAVSQTQIEPQTTQSENSSDNMVPILAGTVTAVVVLVGGVIAGAVVMRRRKNRKSQPRKQRENTINQFVTSPNHRTKDVDGEGLVVQYKYPERTASQSHHNQSFNEYAEPDQSPGINEYDKPREF